MAEAFSDFAAWMEALPPLWAYVAILVIAYGENVIPPVPGDLAIVYGGYLAGVGELSLVMVVGLSAFGATLGFMTLYALGHRLGEAILDPTRMRWVPKAGVYRARAWIERWGWWVVLLNRFLSGVRAVISVTVGIARMDVRTTAVLAATSAVIWASLLAYGGFALGDNFDVVLRWLAAYGRIVGSVLGAAVVVWIARKAWHWHRAR